MKHGSGFSKRGPAELAVEAHQHSGLKHEKRFFFFACVLLLFYQKADFKSTVD